jgi:hypothetical protein
MGTALLALAYTLTAALAQEPKDPETILQSFDSELQKGIKTAPKDPSTRTKLIATSKVVFDQDMKSATLKAPRSKWDCHQQYIENLIAAEKRYGDADTKVERVAWLAASKVVLQFRLTHANEPADKPTTDEAFTELFTAIDKVRKDFPSPNSADVRTLGYSAAKQVFSDRLATARASGRDPQSAYAEHLIKVDKEYPLPQAAPPPSQASAAAGKTKSAGGGKSPKGGGGGDTPAPEKKETDFHTEPNQLLKTAAKAAFDRALAAPKQ